MTDRRTIIGELKRRAIQLVEVIWYTGVIIVLVIWILPDLLPRRKRK